MKKILGVNSIFLFFLAAGIFQSIPMHAALSALNQSIVTMETILSSPLMQTELSPYEKVILLKESHEKHSSNTSATHLTYVLETEVIIDSHEHHHHKLYLVDIVVTPNSRPGPQLLEVVSIKPYAGRSHSE